jgi:hypothetical protein
MWSHNIANLQHFGVKIVIEQAGCDHVTPYNIANLQHFGVKIVIEQTGHDHVIP